MDDLSASVPPSPDPTPPASRPRRWDWRPKARWFAAEYLIVVLGVLTAVGANAWWTARATAARAEDFTARLTDDVRYEAWANEWLIVYYTEVLRNAEVAAAALSGDTTLTDDAFLIAAYRATQYKQNERARATYDELVSTGEVGLIADDTLREAAIGIFTTPYFEYIAEEGTRSEYRRAFRRVVPAAVQRALLRSCGDHWPETGDYQALVGVLDYPCTLDLPPERIARAASALRADPAVLPALQVRFGDLETIVSDLTIAVPVMRGNLRRIAARPMTDLSTPPASVPPPTDPAPSTESPRRAPSILGQLASAVREQN